ncbi:Pentapeptide repeats (8 copies) [uncultured archaeon]|nr:Pentapeptide repeats (8 copies) [uncultured archaeon]
MEINAIVANCNNILMHLNSVKRNAKKHLGFWKIAFILFFLSNLIVLGISLLFHLPYYLGRYGIPDIPYFSPLVNSSASIDFEIAAIWSKTDNARYILSSLSQVQAAIFGIFFTLNFIIFQIQIPNCSPISIKKSLSSSKLMFILIVFIFSISFDLISIRYITPENEINIFWALSLSIFAVLILIPYMRITLLDLVKESLIEEISSGRARHNLEEVDLSGISINNIDLQNRILRRADLSSSRLSWVDLSGSNFDTANLSDTRLTQVKLNKSNLYYANFNGATIAMTELKEAMLFGADLSAVKFTRVDLSNAHLNGANLVGTEFCPGTILNGTHICEDWSDGVGPKRKTYVLKYDEKTIDSLLANMSIDVAIFDGSLREDLIKRANELLNDTHITDESIANLQSFLISQGVTDFDN